jgi:D-sedoheptulose 7-phosphate isomerase
MSGADTLRMEWDEHLQVATDAAALLPTVERLADAVVAALAGGGKVLVFGNGGSAADAQHFVGELLGRFRDTRRPLPAIALSADPSVVTGVGNDFGFDDLFARQVAALAAAGDVAIGITTSGSSENVVRGLRAAREAGALPVAWTGVEPGAAGAAAEIVLAVPSQTTARIQEIHTLAMHALCVAVDAWVASEAPT